MGGGVKLCLLHSQRLKLIRRLSMPGKEMDIQTTQTFPNDCAA
jgi:hypothetical protein